MDYKAHVFFINTHTKCCCGDDDIIAFFVSDPAMEGVGALCVRETGVVGFCAYAVVAEACGEGLAVFAVECIDDSRNVGGSFFLRC